MKNRVLFSMMAALLMVAALFFFVGTKLTHASTLLLTCPLGTDNVLFHPGITNTAQTVTFTESATLGGCVDTSDSSLTGGTESSSASLRTSCTSLAFPSSFTATFRWNNSSHSSSIALFTTVTTTRLVDGTTQVVRTGTITSGLAEGDRITQTFTLPVLNLTACETPQGLTSVSGAVAAIIEAL